MNGTIYICASAHFPHGDAGANRIQYMAQGLQAASYPVVVLSCGKTPDNATRENGYDTHCGVPYRNLEMTNLKKEKLLSGYKMVSLMKKCGVCANDIVYIYGSNVLFVEPVLRYCKRHHIKTIIDVVEWHQPFQYPKQEKDVRYRSVNRTFSKLALQTDGIISISKCIADYYHTKHRYTDIFPVIIDAQSIPFVEREPAEDDTVHCIYPGNPIHKDDVGVMLDGLALLTDSEKKRVKMHFTGVTEQKIRAYLENRQIVIDELGDALMFHGWMEYDELIDLYRKVDYLYMSRPDNLVTQANFPSKLPELMAYGIIPIGNRVGDYWTYLTDGMDSIIFGQNTAEECAEALRRALSQTPQERKLMSLSARKTTCEKFDYRNWIDQLKGFMEKLS